MPRSNVQIYLHFVFSTKDRRHSLYPEIEKRVYDFFWKKVKELNCEPLAINGMPDHVHILLKFDGRNEIPVLVKKLKGPASRFINEHFDIPAGFEWQRGYGVFSVGPRDVDIVHNYIKRQKEHHSSQSEIEEYEL